MDAQTRDTETQRHRETETEGDEERETKAEGDTEKVPRSDQGLASHHWCREVGGLLQAAGFSLEQPKDLLYTHLCKQRCESPSASAGGV